MWIAVPATAQDPRALDFEEPRVTLAEEVYLDQVVEHRFVFRNTGEGAVSVEEVVDVGGSAELEVEPRTLAAGAAGTITVHQPMRRLGRFNHRYAVLTDEPGRPRYRFTLSGFAQSAYDPEVVRIDFGWVERRRGGRQSFELASREVERLQLVGTAELPAHLRLSESGRTGVADEGLELALELLPGAPLGLLDGELIVETNVAHHPRQRVSWSAQVFGDVVPDVNPLDLGLGREGERLEKDVTLRSRGGVAFTVTGVDGLPEQLAADAAPCGGAEAPAPCWRLRLAATSDERAQLQGEMRVHLAGEAEPLPLRFRAIFVGAETRIRQLQAPEPGGGR